MVSSTSIAFMAVALVIQFFAPIVLVLYFYQKEKLSIGTVFTGALVFLISQIIIRTPLLNILQGTPWYQNFASNHKFALYLFLSFTAGLFEECGRYLGFKFVFKIKNKLEWKSGLALGIGHGGLESMYIGIASINNIIISLMINSGVFDSTVARQLPAETAQFVRDQLVSTPSSMFLAGGLERLFTLFIQIGLSMVVLYAVRNRKIIFLPIAIALHTLVNMFALLISEFLGIWAAEVFICAAAIVSAILTFKSKKYFIDETESQSIENVETANI